MDPIASAGAAEFTDSARSCLWVRYFNFFVSFWLRLCEKHYARQLTLFPVFSTDLRRTPRPCPESIVIGVAPHRVGRVPKKVIRSLSSSTHGNIFTHIVVLFHI